MSIRVLDEIRFTVGSLMENMGIGLAQTNMGLAQGQEELARYPVSGSAVCLNVEGVIPPPPPPPPEEGVNWLPIALIGGGVLAAAAIISKKKKTKPIHKKK